jgi:hypothetical protein
MEEKARRNVSIEDEVTTFSLHLLPLHYLYKKNDSAKKSFVHNSTAVSFIPIVLDLNCNSFGSQDLAGMCFAGRGNFVWQCFNSNPECWGIISLCGYLPWQKKMQGK